MITIPELQSMMRAFGGPLEGSTVEQNALVPYFAVIRGQCSLNGQLHAYEAELDIRGINKPTDVITVAQALLDNMKQAEAQARTQV